MSKSRPVYAPFSLDFSGRAHLIVTDQALPPEEADLALSNIEAWTVQTIAPGIEAPATQNVRAFRAKAGLLSQLGHRLAQETMGLRLYALGAESFLWDVYNLAAATGMGRTEVFLTRAGPLTRRVYCTHCKTIIEDVARNIAPCPGCGAQLFVRDHFSRRLAAFMGVKVDAEVPGEIPLPEVFTS
jgi:dimethylamine monooxygenase subunit C